MSGVLPTSPETIAAAVQDVPYRLSRRSRRPGIFMLAPEQGAAALTANPQKATLFFHYHLAQPEAKRQRTDDNRPRQAPLPPPLCRWMPPVYRDPRIHTLTCLIALIQFPHRIPDNQFPQHNPLDSARVLKALSSGSQRLLGTLTVNTPHAKAIRELIEYTLCRDQDNRFYKVIAPPLLTMLKRLIKRTSIGHMTGDFRELMLPDEADSWPSAELKRSIKAQLLLLAGPNNLNSVEDKREFLRLSEQASTLHISRRVIYYSPEPLAITLVVAQAFVALGLEPHIEEMKREKRAKYKADEEGGANDKSTSSDAHMACDEGHATAPPTADADACKSVIEARFLALTEKQNAPLGDDRKTDDDNGTWQPMQS